MHRGRIIFNIFILIVAARQQNQNIRGGVYVPKDL